MQQVSKEPAMMNPFLRPARLALLVGLIVLSGSAAEAGNFGANLNIRTSSQSFPQTVLATGRPSLVGLGTSTTPPPPIYQGGGPHRPHAFDPNTQFDGVTDTSTNGKLPK
jgi:hypothetical protein